MVRSFKLTLEYDGTDFAGFQWQKKGRTVQGELERCLERVMQERVRVVGAGRTDAGVHARGQVVRFQTGCRIPASRIAVALNAALPPDIVVRRVQQVGAEFHPRYDASARLYRYLIDNRGCPSPLLRRFAHHEARRLNVGQMQEAANYLVGVHDFAAFHSRGSHLGGTVREIFAIRCTRRGGLVAVAVEANSFLYHMVRNIVGTLLQVGRGERPADDIPRLLSSRDRRQAGPPAPARGLCLERVRY